MNAQVRSFSLFWPQETDQGVELQSCLIVSFFVTESRCHIQHMKRAHTERASSRKELIVGVRFLRGVGGTPRKPVGTPAEGPMEVPMEASEEGPIETPAEVLPKSPQESFAETLDKSPSRSPWQKPSQKPGHKFLAETQPETLGTSLGKRGRQKTPQWGLIADYRA